MYAQPLYRELFRPQFHFTSQRNWLNDPNGLVYFEGEYHLFFQYHARGINWGPNSWGHSVSTDLVHWKELPVAIEPDDEFGWIWSGSAVVDWHNTSGLGDGSKPPLIAVYSAGDPRRGKPVVQCLAFSHDRGRSWTKFDQNPIIPHIEGENRDPKVIWHAPSRRWIMVLYLDRHDFVLFASPNLREWSRLCTVPIPGTSECPDLFELRIDKNPSRTAWVLWGGGGLYRLGSFDGSLFAPLSEPLVAEFGPHGYAAQTWSDVPGDRRIQISWMRGGRYPYMPFNQQMSFPVELELRTLPEGVRLCRNPIKEIASLWRRCQRWEGYDLAPGASLVPAPGEGLYDLSMIVEPSDGGLFRCRIHGNELTYRSQQKALSFLDKEIQLKVEDGRLEMRVLVDRTSVEIFTDRGSVSASFCFLPVAWDVPLEFSAHGGEIKLVLLEVRQIASAWI